MLDGWVFAGWLFTGGGVSGLALGAAATEDPGSADADGSSPGSAETDTGRFVPGSTLAGTPVLTGSAGLGAVDGGGIGCGLNIDVCAGNAAIGELGPGAGVDIAAGGVIPGSALSAGFSANGGSLPCHPRQ